MTKPHIDITTLASLARLAISETEKQKLEKEVPNILAFIDTIQSAHVDHTPTNTALRNVLRDDVQPHDTAMFTDRIIAEAPESTNNRIVVKQVVSRNI